VIPENPLQHLTPLQLSCLNTAEALDAFWSRTSVREGYFGPVRLQHFEKVADFLSRLDLPVPFTVLDVGCGPGKLAAALHRRFAVTYTGLDYAASAIEWAREENPLDTFLVGDITCRQALPSFDLVVCCQSLEHIPDWQAAVSEMQRLSHGSLLITVPDGEHDTFPAHLNHWTFDQARAQFAPCQVERVATHIHTLFILKSHA
jgi:trans-aconitate methyltransferase